MDNTRLTDKSITDESEFYHIYGDLVNSDVNDRFLSHFSKTIVRDDVIKRVVFLTALSAYSNYPINLFLKGPSSIGKTYNPVQILKYFPQEDVWYLGGLSPTALIHEKGTLVDENGEPIDLNEKPRKNDFKDDPEGYQRALKEWEERLRNSNYEIELSHKILVFLEAPHIDTYLMLRPLLSHDAPEISYKFTDKGRLRTSHVILRGWPATIFCTSDVKYIEDLATRGFTVTPEMTIEKYKEAIRLTARTAALPKNNFEDEDYYKLRGFLNIIIDRCKEGINEVLVPYAEKLSEVYPTKLPRDMRDFKRFLTLIQLNALLNRFNRWILEYYDGKKHHWFILANIRDLEEALNIFHNLEETTKTGIPGHILRFYHEIIVPVCEEHGNVTYEDLTNKYNETYEDRRSTDSIRKWCKSLYEIGFIDIAPHPEDKRCKVIKVTSKNSGKNTILIKEDFFMPKDFKEWFFKVKNIVGKDLVYIRQKFNKPPTIDCITINKENFPMIFYSEYSVQNQKISEKKDGKSRIAQFLIKSESSRNFRYKVEIA